MRSDHSAEMVGSVLDEMMDSCIQQRHVNASTVGTTTQLSQAFGFGIAEWP